MHVYMSKQKHTLTISRTLVCTHRKYKHKKGPHKSIAKIIFATKSVNGYRANNFQRHSIKYDEIFDIDVDYYLFV